MYIFAVSYFDIVNYTISAGVMWTPITLSGSVLGIRIGSNGMIFAFGYNPTFPTTSLIYKSNVSKPIFVV